MDFSPKLRDGVIGGDITVSVRLWQRPRVKVGKRYPVGPVHIEIDSIELLPFGLIDSADVRRSGEPDLATLRERAAHSGLIYDETLVYRIEFHVV
ncbi:MAG TPA: hypothetical protein VFQ44_10525 [Streptosporangiaceae bacterium]|nr:hypothetical protein [Streptosporangiaceae bacterium]